MAKKAKKSKSVLKVAKKKQTKTNSSSKKITVPTVKTKGQTYSSVPHNELVQPKSVKIELPKSDLLEYSTTPSFAPTIPAASLDANHNSSFSRTTINAHSYGAAVFLILGAIGYWFSLVFVSNSQWVFFLFSLMVMIFCLDSFIAIMYRRQEAKHPFELPGIDNIHQITMHVFLLLVLIAIVFSLAFYLEGRWIMLLLSMGAGVVAFDNMLLAKRKHETH